MSVIEYAKDSSASAASRFFNIHRSMVKSHVKTMMRSNMPQMSHGTEATVYKRNLSKIAKAVRAAWHRVTPETIRNGFRKMMHST